MDKKLLLLPPLLVCLSLSFSGCASSPQVSKQEAIPFCRRCHPAEQRRENS